MDIVTSFMLLTSHLTLGKIGINIKKNDSQKDTIYLEMPKYSYGYEIDGKSCSVDEYAKYIQETAKMALGFSKVKYKVKNVNWTKEMSAGFDRQFQQELGII
jgi:hypothetical protein